MIEKVFKFLDGKLGISRKRKLLNFENFKIRLILKCGQTISLQYLQRPNGSKEPSGRRNNRIHSKTDPALYDVKFPKN